MQTLRKDARQAVETIRVDHPVMPVELVIAGTEVAIHTGKSGSQTQMLMNDVSVLLSIILEQGIDAAELADRLGSVDERDALVTRRIIDAVVSAKGGVS
jgi:hypothetical protein